MKLFHVWVCGFLRPKCCQFLFSRAFATDFCFERLVTRGTDSLQRDVQMRFCSSPTLNTGPENDKDVGLLYWAGFHWHNPNIQICCRSSHRRILLTNLAPLKMGLNKLSNCMRFVAKICNSEQILHPAHISFPSAFQAKNEWWTGEALTFFVVPHKLCITIYYPLPATCIFCMAVTEVKKCYRTM